MTDSETSGRLALAELIGPPDGELTVEALPTPITVLFFVADDPETPSVYVVTLGLASRAPLSGAERYELGVRVGGVYSPGEIDRLGRALVATAQQLSDTVLAPEEIVPLGELQFAFPKRAQAMVYDFMSGLPDYLPVGDTGETARLLFLNPLFEAETRWVRTMSQAEVRRIFAQAEVDFADPDREPLIVSVGPKPT